MMSDFTKVTNINANSLIGGEKVVSMRATIAEDGTVNFGKTIRNTEVYMANTEECDADYKEFETAVLALV